MKASSSQAGPTPPATTAGAPSASRRGSGARTRGLLLDAARRRFAHDGYAATTVRDIADDAGVNVALINRYFQSKEGLFEVCLKAVIDELVHTAAAVADLGRAPERIGTYTAGLLASDGHSDALLLLLRSSGDERTERMRSGLLRTFSERLASAVGHGSEEPVGQGSGEPAGQGSGEPAGQGSGEPADDELLLRAQLVLSVAFGVTVLRASRSLEPLASATEQDLAGPLSDLVDALLTGRGRENPWAGRGARHGRADATAAAGDGTAGPRR